MVQSGFGTGWSYTLGWVEGNLPFDVFRSSLALPSLLTPTALRFSLPFSGVHTRDLLHSFTCWGTLGFKRQFPFQTKGNHKRRQMCQRTSSMMETPSFRPTSPTFLSAWISPLLKLPCLSLWNKRTRPTCTTWGSFTLILSTLHKSVVHTELSRAEIFKMIPCYSLGLISESSQKEFLVSPLPEDLFRGHLIAFSIS